jgi:hypothetical protein
LYNHVIDTSFFPCLVEGVAPLSSFLVEGVAPPLSLEGDEEKERSLEASILPFPQWVYLKQYCDHEHCDLLSARTMVRRNGL